MSITFEAATPEQRAGLRAFLLETFQLPETAPFVDAGLLAWKYDAPRADWQGPRSYVYRKDGEFAAHGCIWPVTFQTAAGPVSSMRIIDWAGGRIAPSAGAMLMKKMTSFTDTVLAVGGSEETQKVAPAIGFRITGHCAQYAKVLRPWRQMQTYQAWNWKSPVRLVRNSVWSFGDGACDGWRWRAVHSISSEMTVAPESGYISCKRTPGQLEYLLTCPSARMSAFLLEQQGRPRGYGLLAHIAGQTRLADLQLAGPAGPADWTAAYSLAIAAAKADPDACELVTYACLPHRAEALTSCGFRLTHSEPVYLLDPRKRLVQDAASPMLALDLQMADGDEFFLYDPARPYWT